MDRTKELHVSILDWAWRLHTALNKHFLSFLVWILVPCQPSSLMGEKKVESIDAHCIRLGACGWKEAIFSNVSSVCQVHPAGEALRPVGGDWTSGGRAPLQAHAHLLHLHVLCLPAPLPHLWTPLLGEWGGGLRRNISQRALG